MDVLQLLKLELKERAADLASLISHTPGKKSVNTILARLRAHLSLETVYLLPELTAISFKNDLVVSKLESELLVIQELLTLASEGDQTLEVWQKLNQAFAAHAQSIEERALPFMRQKITTAEREELFHVLQDAKQDLMMAASLEQVM